MTSSEIWSMRCLPSSGGVGSDGEETLKKIHPFTLVNGDPEVLTAVLAACTKRTTWTGKLMLAGGNCVSASNLHCE